MSDPIKTQVEKLWNKIAQSFPDSSVCNAGASPGQIKELEDLIGKPLPKDYRAFLEICNGLGKGGWIQLSPTPYSTTKICDHSRKPSAINFDDDKETEFSPTSKENQAFQRWPKNLLKISECDDFGHSIDLDTGKTFFYDYVDGGHVRYVCDSFVAVLEQTVSKIEPGKSVEFGSLG